MRIDAGGPHFTQLAGYIATNGVTLCILTNHVRVNTWQFRPEGHTPLCSLDLRELYEQRQRGGSLTPPSSKSYKSLGRPSAKRCLPGWRHSTPTSTPTLIA